MKTRYVYVALLLLALVGPAIWFLLPAGARDGRIRNVILISIDTCRADYLGCYGYRRATTPNIDAVAGDAVLFENAVTPVPITLPAHTSMLAGTTPVYHQVHDNGNYYVAPYNRTLAQILGEHGYRTAAFVSAAVLHREFGLARGFDTYDDDFSAAGETGLQPQRRATETSDRAVDWLEGHKDENFFLFLHYFDPHFPYEPPEPFGSLFGGNPYAGEIAYTDFAIGRVTGKLKELGLYETTLLIITADHGEMLGEHSELTHAFFIYQSALRVPLIMRIPHRNKPVRVSARVSLIDIAPTVCGLLGIEPPAVMQGGGLGSYIKGRAGPAGDRSFYCESLYPTIYGCNPLLGIISGRWKYIKTTRPELYDVWEDPAESRNLIDIQPKRAHLLDEHLKLMVKQLAHDKSFASRAVIDEKTLRSIESLGYLASARVDDSFEFDGSRQDPKDFINFHCENMAIGTLFNARKFEQAKTLCRRMLSERPGYVQSYVYLGSIALEQGDNEAVISNHLKYIEHVDPDRDKPDRPDNKYADLSREHPPLKKAHLELAMACYKLARFEQALRHARIAVRLGPTSRQAHNTLGIILAHLGDNRQAAAHFQQALRLGLDSFDVHYNLATVLEAQGETSRAVEHYQRCLELDPARRASILYRLGSVFLKGTKPDRARQCWREALELAQRQGQTKLVADIKRQLEQLHKNRP